METMRMVLDEPYPGPEFYRAPADTFNPEQRDTLSGPNNLQSSSAANRAARQQVAVLPTDAPFVDAAVDRSRFLLDMAFGPAPVIGGGNGVQETSVNKDPQQAQRDLAEFAGPALLEVAPGTDLMRFDDVPVIGSSSSELPQATSLMTSSVPVASSPYLAPLISGSPDRSPPQTPRTATPTSSDDEGSGYNSGLNWESDNLLFGGFPGGEFPNWYPDDDRRDK